MKEKEACRNKTKLSDYLVCEVSELKQRCRAENGRINRWCLIKEITSRAAPIALSIAEIIIV